MYLLSEAEINEVSGAGFWYDVGRFWGRAFAKSDFYYPMAGSGYALGA